VWHIKQCKIVEISSIFYVDLIQNQPCLIYSKRCTPEVCAFAVGQQWATCHPQILKSFSKISWNVYRISSQFASIILITLHPSKKTLCSNNRKFDLGNVDLIKELIVVTFLSE